MQTTRSIEGLSRAVSVFIFLILKVLSGLAVLALSHVMREKEIERDRKMEERPTTVCPRCWTKLPPPIMLGTFKPDK